jgi:hypothetical protein
VLALSPSPPKLVAMPISPAASQFVFQLQGQAGVSYVIQCSTNLTAWNSVSTNTLPASTMNITNSLVPFKTVQFWRAIWQP